jgi:transcriptional regulator with XRE-family HTH domain
MTRKLRPVANENPLQRYKIDHGLTDDALAALCGIRREMVCRFRRGHRRPSLDDALAIERATQGAVPVQSWGGRKAKHCDRCGAPA